MDLKTISNDLMKADEELATKLIALLPLEKKYTTRYNTLLVGAQGLASQPLREAEVQEQLKQEGIYDEYHEAKLQVKLAYSRRDTLMEISRNIRSYAFES